MIKLMRKGDDNMRQILKVTALTAAIVSLLSIVLLFGIYVVKACSYFKKAKKKFFTCIPSYLLKKYRKRKLAKKLAKLK
jgi:ABC-type phosphate transport system permease subunit